MTIHQAAAYLIRFDSPPSTPLTAGANDDAPALESLHPEPALLEIPSPEPQRSEEEIRAELELEFTRKLEVEREAFARCLSDERERWATEQADALSRHISTAHETAIIALRADLTRTLYPFLSRAIADRVLDDLVSSVRQGFARENPAAITISAPKDLLEKIEPALKAENIAITALEATTVDARVAFCATTVETCLGDWINRLSNNTGDG